MGGILSGDTVNLTYTFETPDAGQKTYNIVSDNPNYTVDAEFYVALLPKPLDVTLEFEYNGGKSFTAVWTDGVLDGDMLNFTLTFDSADAGTQITKYNKFVSDNSNYRARPGSTATIVKRKLTLANPAGFTATYSGYESNGITYRFTVAEGTLESEILYLLFEAEDTAGKPIYNAGTYANVCVVNPELVVKSAGDTNTFLNPDNYAITNLAASGVSLAINKCVIKGLQLTTSDKATEQILSAVAETGDEIYFTVTVKYAQDWDNSPLRLTTGTEAQGYVTALNKEGKENTGYFLQDMEMDAFAYAYAVMTYKYGEVKYLYVPKAYRNNEFNKIVNEWQVAFKNEGL